MAVQSRSRATRTAGEKTHASRRPAPPRSDNNQQQQQHASSQLSHPSEFNDDEPPAKKRKLSIRSKQQSQSTLDHFTFAQSAPGQGQGQGQPKPPTKVSVAQPHGRLIETVNGVQNVLDIDEDELALPHATPKPKAAIALQPSSRSDAPAKQEDKRTLRSQDDGPRLKSELAIYFPNYEDIVFDVAKEPEFLTTDSTLYITDDTPKPEQLSPAKGSKNGKSKSSSTSNGAQYPPTPSTLLNGSPALNLSTISNTLPDHPTDPLPDSHYAKPHRRAERKEKQLRNIEKERAMHEKVQLDRLLAGLQAHDWLKVLGITGVTEGEARKYEPKRDFFIAEVKALVDKFRQWKEEEKKLRMGGARVVAKEEEDEEEEDEEGSVEPPSSDLNASAARQLQQETIGALKSSTATASFNKHSKGKERAPPVTFQPPPPEIPISSFYAKRHLRDAALGKARHGRNVTAFGHPIPELREREFELPDDYVTEDTLAANARERRRRKRASIADAASSAG
ncbi:hypothetical protein LTR37_011009 [Vermiconidia calcicola]|uniref:Uncharacterized protein n=1 Tax=Vermiconidia calcicola TaxID=1690605 RepID=A0ACC3N674_9PEZI|nr:hypothetical protein LTR37_011009 [Vermiconidia calcicola]